MTSLDPTSANGAWLKPAIEETSLQRYIRTLRERKWLILATVVACTLAAVVYVATADKVYRAEADLLVTPVPGGDSTLTGLGLIHDSSDPTRDVSTAARLVTTNGVARRVKTQLNDPRTPANIVKAVDVAPVAESNIVAITAEGPTPTAAQRLANGFATQAVTERTDQFHRQIDDAISNIQQRLNRSPESGAVAASPDSLTAQQSRLQTLRDRPDPTMRVEALADAPTSPVSPRPKLAIAAAIVAGLVLGIGGAFALTVLDPRLRREDQLRSLYGLPILARIPQDAKSHGKGARAPEHLAPPTIEAYRTLRATLSASRGRSDGARSILVTSPSPGEGKTTTAINLASSLALAGNTVILIEVDLRRPAVGKALGVGNPGLGHGTGSVLLETTELRDALVTTPAYGNYLQLLLADTSGGATSWMADRLFLPAAQQLVEDAKELADYVIIDSPPLSEVIDALQLAQRADDVLVVVRLGKSHLAKLANLSEILARHGIRPVGFAVVGAETPGGDSYYYLPQRPKGSERKSRSQTV
jgi:capsular exopolysaccharide synthesis family protein